MQKNLVNRKDVAYTNVIFGILLLSGSVFSCMAGVDAVAIMSESAMETVQFCVRLAGGYAVFSGFLAIFEDSGAISVLIRFLRTPILTLFPGIRGNHAAQEAVCENLIANLAGLGNAATPAGLRAMQEMHAQKRCVWPNDDMCMLLVINATGVQILPTGVMALRAAAGSVHPGSILVPTLLSTALSTVVGVLICVACREKR